MDFDPSVVFPQTCYEGLFYALIAIGVYITFRVLAFPDLSVDGTFPLGGAIAAVLISDHALNPFLATRTVQSMDNMPYPRLNTRPQ